MAVVQKESCDHDFRFLRRERRDCGFPGKPDWVTEEVFYCRKCLKFKRALVQKEGDGGDRPQQG